MDSKTKDGHRLIVSNKVEIVPKPKGKDRARKELWDSLCAVYENEADKENGEVEIEEVDVSELEQWTLTNPDTSMRATEQLAVTNPQILSAAASNIPDNADLILELELQDKKEVNVNQANKKIKQKRSFENLKKCRCKSSPYMKSAKLFSPVKKCMKPRSMSQKEQLIVSLTRRKIEEKKSKCLIKRQHEGEGSEICLRKRGRKQKAIQSIEFKESLGGSKGPTSGIKNKKGEESYQSHQCKLEYRSYSKTKIVSTRSDNRVFNCKLIFKVCHCTESDIIL